MEDRHRRLIEELAGLLSEGDKEVCRSIAYYLIELNYTPYKLKQQDFMLDFRNSRIKEKIAKMGCISADNNRFDFRLKFYAVETYSEKFRNAVQYVIEEFDGKYTGCYGCGKCKDNLLGYLFRYEDGKEVFRCGTELLSINNITMDDVDEVKILLQHQHSFFLNNLSKE
jgi:hypothetical protein